MRSGGGGRFARNWSEDLLCSGFLPWKIWRRNLKVTLEPDVRTSNYSVPVTLAIRRSETMYILSVPCAPSTSSRLRASTKLVSIS